MSSALGIFRKNAWLAIAVVSGAALILAPSDRSLWIDEGWSARMIMAPADLSQWWQMTLHDSAAMATQFGHSLTGFLLGRIFGYSEHSLRMANIVWAFAGVAAFALAGRKLGLSWLPLVFAANPFVWFYVDEIRPYAMQLAAGSWMMLAFLHITSPETSVGNRTLWVNVFWLSCLIVYAASVLGAFSIAAACCVAGAVLLFTRQVPRRGFWLSCAIWVVLLASLTAFHAYFIFVEGKEGAKQWNPGLMNVAFSVYEISGLMGWGPNRDAIRAAVKEGGLEKLASLFVPYLAGLVCYAAVLALGTYGILKQVTQNGVKRAPALWLSAVAVSGLIFMFFAASLANWPFWGRHVSPLFPFAAVALALGFSALGNLGRISAGVWVVMMLVGSLHGRFIQKDHSDDYRAASRVAAMHLAKSQVVWWSAETLTPNYYGVFPASAHGRKAGQEHLALGPSAWPRPTANAEPLCYSVVGLSLAELEQLPPPNIVVASKPDAWDASGDLKEWLEISGFSVSASYPAFQIWSKP